jgi:putative repA protein
VDIFDRTRRWAFRANKRNWTDGINVWVEVVHAHAIAANLNLEKEHRDPLPEKEIHRLAPSIAHWVWTRFNPEQLSAIRAARGKSGEKRSQQRNETASEVPNGQARCTPKARRTISKAHRT